MQTLLSRVVLLQHFLLAQSEEVVLIDTGVQPATVIWAGCDEGVYDSVQIHGG